MGLKFLIVESERVSENDKDLMDRVMDSIEHPFKNSREKIKKLPWKYILPIVLVITIALNIWLLCMPVFKSSSYRGSTNHWACAVEFDHNTFFCTEKEIKNEGTTYKYGFFSANKDNVKFYSSSYMAPYGGNECKRNNVFSITLTRYVSHGFSNGEYEDIVCTNNGAVTLQLFYAIIILSCLIASIYVIIKTIKNQSSKKKRID